MTDLVVSDIELINRDGAVLVSSRQVAEKFGKDHKNVLRDVKELLLSIGAEKDVLKSEPIFIESTYPDGYSRPQPEYLMTRDGFILLAMGFTGADAVKWKIKFIQAFNAMEAKLKEIASNPFAALSGMTSEQIRLYADERAAKEKAQAEVAAVSKQLEEAKPKVEFVDNFVASKGFLSMGEAAKVLGFGRNSLFELLRYADVVIKNSTSPKQWAVNQGLFVLKTWCSNGINGSTSRVTPKGMTWLAENLTKLKDKAISNGWTNKTQY
jgi:anti-repressor protein